MSKQKKKISQREINEEIEALFSKDPHDFMNFNSKRIKALKEQRKEVEKKKIKQEKSIKKQQEEDIFKKKLLFYTLNIEQLLKYFVYLTLMLLLGSIVVFLWGSYQENKSKEKIETFKISRLNRIDTFVQIIASPLISDVNNDEILDIIYGDSLGNLYALDGISMKKVYHFQFPSAIISSPVAIDLDNKLPKEILSISQEGIFFTLDQDGNYLYGSREKFFKEKIFAKPGIIEQEKNSLIIIAGMNGSLWAIDALYGRIQWINQDSPLQGDKIFAAPVILSVNKDKIPDIIVATEEGQIAAFNGINGTLLWHLKVKNSFKASMSVGYFKSLTEPTILLAGLTGEIFLINPKNGKIENFIDIKEKVVSSVGKGKRINGQDYGIISTKLGKIIQINFEKDTVNGLKKPTLKVIKNEKNSSFTSSPIVADFNKDKISDILVIDRNGTIFMINGKTNEYFFSPYKLKYNVTATPLIADLNKDNNLEIIICGENGSIDILTLNSSPEKSFLKNTVIRGEFLGNKVNHN